MDFFFFLEKYWCERKTSTGSLKHGMMLQRTEHGARAGLPLSSSVKGRSGLGGP